MSAIVRLGAVCAGALLVHLVVACAASEDARPQPEADSGAVAPPTDAAAPPTEDEDADVDASPPRECSDDGFCHTALPKGQTLRAV